MCCVLIGTVCYFPAGRSRTAGRKVQQKSVGEEVEKTTETETEREGAQLNVRGQGDYIAVPVLCLYLYLCFNWNCMLLSSRKK